MYIEPPRIYKPCVCSADCAFILHSQVPNHHNANHHARLWLSCTYDSNAHSPNRYLQCVEQKFANVSCTFCLSVHIPLRSQRGREIVSRARNLFGYTTDPIGTLADIVLVNRGQS
jgi:hypothetical protein